MNEQFDVNSPHQPDFSLIVATLHDDGQLAHFLGSLTGLEPACSFEVIIVDQNADERVAPLAARYAECYPLRHLRADFRGASRARNLGASVARGRWLSFPDDDCRYHADTLSRARAVLEQDGVRVAAGRTVDADLRPSVLRWARHKRRMCPWSMFMCLSESTLFVERELFLEATGFDERFGPGGTFPAAEGIELMNRLFAARRGQSEAFACFDPAITLYHPDKVPPWNAWAARRFFHYAVGDGALIAKSPQPHMLYWGARTLASACLQALFFRGWVSVAFAARVAGLLKGAGSYVFTGGRGAARR